MSYRFGQLPEPVGQANVLRVVHRAGDYRHPFVGDAIVQNAPLYNATGKKRIGRFDLFCAVTDPADESSEKAHMAECTKTFTLPGGEISVQGREAYPDELSARPTPGEDAITGGTGKYAGVRGEQRFEPRRTKGINTFHFIG